MFKNIAGYNLFLSLASCMLQLCFVSRTSLIDLLKAQDSEKVLQETMPWNTEDV